MNFSLIGQNQICSQSQFSVCYGLELVLDYKLTLRKFEKWYSIIMFSELFSDWSKTNLLSNSIFSLIWAWARARLAFRKYEKWYPIIMFNTIFSDWSKFILFSILIFSLIWARASVKLQICIKPNRKWKPFYDLRELCFNFSKSILS